MWQRAWDFATGSEAKKLLHSVKCQHRVIRCVEESR